jgi:hypothetical protein
MDYEDIEPPTPEVDKLYQDIITEYKAGKYSSQEEALTILESRYFFSFIDIKEELHGEFEVHPYYIYGEMGNLDEYIRVCEKSDNSPTSTEQDIFIQILNGLIKKVHVFAQKTDELKHIKSYEDAAKCVYRQVEKVRKLSRMNRESKELYEKYKSQIESIPETKKHKKVITKDDEIAFIKLLLDAVQIETERAENGKYNLVDSAENFIHWYIYNNYQENEKYQFLPKYMEKYINHHCTIETLKRYVRDKRKLVPAQIKNEKIMETLKENKSILIR